MAPFLRKVKTASGATAAQIAVRENKRDRVLEHLGFVHTPAELAALMEAGREKLHPGQTVLDLDLDAKPEGATSTALLQAKTSRLLIDTIRTAWQ